MVGVEGGENMLESLDDCMEGVVVGGPKNFIKALVGVVNGGSTEFLSLKSDNDFVSVTSKVARGSRSVMLAQP